jgi:hypothetical protein
MQLITADSRLLAVHRAYFHIYPRKLAPSSLQPRQSEGNESHLPS